MMAILTEVRWNLSVVLICLSFIARDSEHFFMCFLAIWGVEFLTQGFVLAKQMPYCLSHTSSPFCSGCFGDGGLMNMNYLLGLASNLDLPKKLELQKGMSHRCPAQLFHSLLWFALWFSSLGFLEIIGSMSLIFIKFRKILTVSPHSSSFFP
jgi:hypothetical protein